MEKMGDARERPTLHPKQEEHLFSNTVLEDHRLMESVAKDDSGYDTFYFGTFLANFY